MTMFCFSDIELRVYGSSSTGFGLKTSDLNMNLVVPDGRNPAQLLTQIYNLIAESGKHFAIFSYLKYLS